MDHWASFISQVGFPIAVTVYLLVRIERRLEWLTTAIHELATSITAMKK